MAVTVGNNSNSGDPGAVTSYSWNHTCIANTSCLVVAIGAMDVSSDVPVTGVTYNTVALTKAREETINGQLVSIWYLLAPTTGSALSIAVTHTGKCTDTAAIGLDLLGTDTVDPYHDIFDAKGFGNANTFTLTCASAPTGSLAVGGYANDIAAPTNISLTTGNEILELDIGSSMVGFAWAAESGGNAVMAWTTLVTASGRLEACLFEPPSGVPGAVVTTGNMTTNTKFWGT